MKVPACSSCTALSSAPGVLMTMEPIILGSERVVG